MGDAKFNSLSQKRQLVGTLDTLGTFTVSEVNWKGIRHYLSYLTRNS